MAESIILSAKVLNVEQDILRGARAAEKALNLKPKIDATSLNKLSGPLGRLNTQADQFTKSLEASNARVLAFGASAGAIFALQRAFSLLIKNTIEVEATLTDINSVLKQNSKELESFSNEIFNVARDTGKSFKEIANGALELSRQGLNATDTLKRLKDAAILARLSGLDTADAVETLTSTINSFNNEALDSNIIINKLSNVAAKFAVSEKDLSEAIKRVGSSASDAGVSFDELVAVVTSAQQTTARGGAVIGNALKTIFTRLQRTDTLNQLEDLGIAVKNVAGETRPAVDILKSLSQVYDTLNADQKSFVSELVGGVFQINQLKAQLRDLGKEYGTYTQALDASKESTNEAIKRNELLNRTTKAQLNALGEAFTQFSANAGKLSLGPIIGNITSFLQTSLDDINKETEQAGQSIGESLLKGIGNALTGPGALVGATVLTALFLKLGKFAFEATKSIIQGLGSAERQKQVQTEIANILARSGKSYGEIIAGARSLEEVQARILRIVRERIALEQSGASLLAGLGGGSRASINLGRDNLSRGGLSFNGGSLSTRKIPNFADPIQAAINREKAAGVPANQIYIDTDPRIKSASNPLGILVANKRDEPKGGYQGVNRAISMGINPKTSGINSVPNFASDSADYSRVFDSSSGLTTRGARGRFQKIDADEISKLNKILSEFRKAAEENSTVLKKAAKDKVQLVDLDKKSRIKVLRALELEEKAINVARQNVLTNAKNEENVRNKINKFRERDFLAAKLELDPRLPSEKAIIKRRNQIEGQKKIDDLEKGFAQIDRAASKVKSVKLPTQKEIDSAYRELHQINVQGELGRRGPNIASVKRATPEQIKSTLDGGTIAENRAYSDYLERQARRAKIAAAAPRREDIFNRALTDSFAARQSGFSGIFGGAKGDEKELFNKLGRSRLDRNERTMFEAKQMELQERRRGRLTGVGIGTAFAGSILSGFIPEEYNKTSGTTTGALTGLSIGSFFGPKGAAVGAVGGGAVGLVTSIGKEAEIAFKKVAKEFEILDAKINTTTNALQSYSNVQSQLNDLIKSGTARSSDITNLNNQLTQLFNQIEDNDIRTKLLASNGSLETIGNLLADAQKSGLDQLAKKSVELTTKAAVSSKNGSILGFGGSITTKNLESVGRALADANRGDPQKIKEAVEAFTEYSKTGNTESLAKGFKALSYDTGQLSKNLIDTATVASSFLESSKINRQIDETGKASEEFLKKLSQFSRDFKEITNTLTTNADVSNNSIAAANNVIRNRNQSRLALASGGATELSIFNAQSDISRRDLGDSQFQERNQLDATIRSALMEFGQENISERGLSVKILDQLKNGSPIDVLKNLTVESGEVNLKLSELKRDFISQLDKLNTNQAASKAILEDQLRIEHELLRRRLAGTMFGGASNFGQELDTGSIERGFAAGAVRASGNRILGGTGYMSRNARRALDLNTQDARVTEARGIIDRGNILGQGIEAFRTPENEKLVREAIETDLREKINKTLASSLRGLFQGEFGRGGAFGVGGTSTAYTGANLSRQVFKSLSESGGQPNFDELEKLVKNSQVGVRAPDTERRLFEAIKTAREQFSKLGEASKEQAKNLFSTPMQIIVEGINKGEIATNTAKTNEYLDSLLNIFKQREKSNQLDKEVKDISNKIIALQGDIGITSAAKNKTIGQSNFKGFSVFDQPFAELAKKSGDSSRFNDSVRSLLGQIREQNPKTLGEVANTALKDPGSDFFVQTVAGGKVGKERTQALYDFLQQFSEKTVNLSEFDKKIVDITNNIEILNKKLDGARERQGAQSKILETVVNQPIDKPNMGVSNTPNFNPSISLTPLDKANGLSQKAQTYQKNILSGRNAMSAILDKSNKVGEISKADLARFDAIKKATEEQQLMLESTMQEIQKVGVEAAAKIGEEIKTVLSGDAALMVKQAITAQIQVVLKDGTVSATEKQDLEKLIGELIEKALLEIKNKQAANEGKSQTPARTPSNTSGAPR